MRTIQCGPLAAILLLACAGEPSSVPPEPEPIRDVAAENYAPQNRPDVAGTEGAVVAGHPLAAAAGHAVLRGGGNAVDAAVTMAAVLAVVRPHMNGVGGDAFALFYRQDSGDVVGLNGSGRSGRLATRDFFLDRGLDRIPTSGPLSVTVPGAVSAWAAALERYGSISLSEALGPAIRYAEEGFPVSTTLSADIEAADNLNAAGRAIYQRAGAPTVGGLLKQPALAGTLRAIAAEGPEVLYGGRIGRTLAEFTAAEGGYLGADDFAAHTATWVDPLSISYLGKNVHALPPNTQGLAQLQQMGMAAHFPLQEMGHNTPDYLHTLIELKKLAFADRDRWIADPAFSPAPLAALLDSTYLRRRAELVGEEAATSVQPGLDEPATSPVGNGESDTVYLMAVDRWGNAVSWIQSLFHAFGSGLVEPGTGVVLQNRGALFSLDPLHPNVIEPEKRSFHTLTPTLVTYEDGGFAMTFGTPGGDSQTQSLLQVFNNLFLFGMTPQEAVEAPRYRSYQGRRVVIEARVPADVRSALEARGHQLRGIPGWTSTFGGVQMILKDPRAGTLRTSADPRREAYGIAY